MFSGTGFDDPVLDIRGHITFRGRDIRGYLTCPGHEYRKGGEAIPRELEPQRPFSGVGNWSKMDFSRVRTWARLTFPGRPAAEGGRSHEVESHGMSTGITREEALELLHEHIENPNMIKHCLASEAVLGAIADRLGTDREKWAMAGLLHDLDVEITHADLSVHGLEAARMLAERGVDPEIVEAIRLHNEQASGEPRTTVFHHALAAGETITGLIVATTLVYPDKKLASVKPKSIVKRMKEKAFARSVNRDIIRECELIGIPLREFAEIALKAMQSISDEMGL